MTGSQNGFTISLFASGVGWRCEMRKSEIQLRNANIKEQNTPTNPINTRGNKGNKVSNKNVTKHKTPINTGLDNKKMEKIRKNIVTICRHHKYGARDRLVTK
ncbi:hypothetical protein CRU98_13235 [Arcobacter sp. CECT 8986]|nr:hypothetical protein CRU98_13235 [Arcobacter sp. CECT 8986]